MAFKKMTAQALYDEFLALFPDCLGDYEVGNSVVKYNKIGARMLRIEMAVGPVLYFLWYDENNWNLGTKPFRNRPKKQRFKKDEEKNRLPAQDDFMNLINDFPKVMFTDISDEPGNENVPSFEQNLAEPPIDWVKEDPQVVMDSYPPSAE